MKILSHRGYWKKLQEKNSKLAFLRSFELNFGTETDVRDCGGKLVISHDIPTGNEFHIEDFLSLLPLKHLPLAINIKSDGTARLLREAMESYGVDSYFTFDMSTPDMREHIRMGNPIFTRMSEIEQNPILLAESKGVWLDAFEYLWYSRDLILSLLDQKKQVCIVSPELHGRDSRAAWEMIAPIANMQDLLICTDFPEEAKNYFGDSAND